MPVPGVPFPAMDRPLIACDVTVSSEGFAANTLRRAFPALPPPPKEGSSDFKAAARLEVGQLGKDGAQVVELRPIPVDADPMDVGHEGEEVVEASLGVNVDHEELVLEAHQVDLEPGTSHLRGFGLRRWA